MYMDFIDNLDKLYRHACASRSPATYKNAHAHSHTTYLYQSFISSTYVRTYIHTYAHTRTHYTSFISRQTSASIRGAKPSNATHTTHAHIQHAHILSQSQTQHSRSDSRRPNSRITRKARSNRSLFKLGRNSNTRETTEMITTPRSKRFHPSDTNGQNQCANTVNVRMYACV
jgi:hypothetical protein